MIIQFFDNHYFNTTKENLKSASAHRMIKFIDSENINDVRLISCKASNCGTREALIIELDVPLGQKKTSADIRLSEPLAIVFAFQPSVPSVYPLRIDFPFHLPHVNVAPSGVPRSLCLSDQPLEDQLRDYTAAQYIELIKCWLVKTAYGELHGDEQPLDPLFVPSQINIIASNKLQEANYVIGRRFSDRDLAPIILAPIDEELFAKIGGEESLLTPLKVKTNQIEHGQINYQPGSLSELFSVYRNLNADIYEALSEAILSVLQREHMKELLDLPMLILIETKIVNTDGRDRLQKKAFVSSTHVGEVGKIMGLIDRVDDKWAQLIVKPEIDTKGFDEIKLEGADLHSHFSYELANKASGYVSSFNQDILLIGAGAIGSHFSMFLARGGIGKWHIVDDDFVLPHNLARYALDAHYIGLAKADGLTLFIRRLLESKDAASSYVHRICRNEVRETDEELSSIKTSADFIVDASASVPLARELALNNEIKGRVASAFMNPKGTDGVLLLEAADRFVTIDCVEMHYYWMLATNERLEDHLSKGEEPLPIGGCRSPSAIIPETQVALLTSLQAGRWLKSIEADEGEVFIWRDVSKFEKVEYVNEKVPNYIEVEMHGWIVKVSDNIIRNAELLRQKCSPQETGGIIAGMWDRLHKIIYVVGIFDAPPDSVETTSSFERGTVGVYKTIKQLQERTLNNLTYIGEWHCHPPKYGSAPSSDDRKLLCWIDCVLEYAEAPAIMLILGDDGMRLVLRDDNKDYDCLL